jgi:hypothetical protein
MTDDVTLVGNPLATKDNVYVLDYISTGNKRGIKHFVCKIVVQSLVGKVACADGTSKCYKIRLRMFRRRS